MRRQTSVCVAILALSVSGCAADYLNNYDTVTLAAGDSTRQNQLLQTVDLFNPNSNNTKGRRTADDGCRSKIPRSAAAGICLTKERRRSGLRRW